MYPYDLNLQEIVIYMESNFSSLLKLFTNNEIEAIESDFGDLSLVINCMIRTTTKRDIFKLSFRI